MSRETDSGAVGNVHETTKKAIVDGKQIVETLKVDKDTGEKISHTVNGEEVKEKKPAVIQYDSGNGQFLMVKLLADIKMILKENTYYVRKICDKLEAEVTDEEAIKEANK